MSKLYFYYSSMNAGKSTYLLQSSYNYRERGMSTALYAPAFDTRFGINKVTSRTGISEDAYTFSTSFEFIEHVNLLAITPHCILIDEAQFLTKKQVSDLSIIVDDMKIPVLTFGIRTDFLGQTFEGSAWLLAWADKLVELKTICHCGKNANFVAKIDESGVPITSGYQIEIGGNEKYVSLCRAHYKRLTKLTLFQGKKITQPPLNKTFEAELN